MVLHNDKGLSASFNVTFLEVRKRLDSVSLAMNIEHN